MTIPLLIRQTIGHVSRVAYPTAGACYRCGVSWEIVTGHYTPHGEKNSCFPLCESCWSELEPEKRIPFYQRLVNEWVSDALAGGDIDEAERLLGVEWTAIKAAVLRGE